MIVLKLTAGTTTASTPIGITTVYNTNANTVVDGNTVKLASPGLYEIQGTATVTSTAADAFGLYVNINNTQYGAQAIGDATGSGETITVPLYADVNVINTAQSGYVTVSLLPVGAPTVVGGTISIKKIN